MGFVGKAFKAIGKVFKGIVGIATKIVGGVFGFLVGGKKKESGAPSVNNLNKSIDPEAYRKIIFGKVASPLDIRFWEAYGTGGNSFVEVIALATHRINAILELYLEENLAINTAGVSQAPFNNGVLTRTTKLGLPGQTALAAGSGSKWNASSKFTGCAHMALVWNADPKKLPDGIPSRYTQVVEGAPVYDPRRDSTRGGSGLHRWNDQTTWEYAAIDPNGVPIGRNNALQSLWYLIGWRIANPITGEMVLVAGRGVDIEDINLSTFIAGANACEIAGYYTDVVLSTGEDHTGNEDRITCEGLIGRLIDPGGLWSYYANVNDTATIAIELTDADIVDGGNVTWNEFRGMSEQFNQVVGKYVNPSAITLFQPFPYPMVRDATYEANLGIKKRRTQDFEQILDSTVAQRLARLRLNEGQYQGEFQAEFLPRSIKAQAWSVVRYTSERFGWVKLFRVWRHDIIAGGKVGMLLKEIHSSIWGAGTIGTPIAPGVSVAHDPYKIIVATGVTVALVPIVGANGTLADAFALTWAAPPVDTLRTEVRYRLVGATNWSYDAFVTPDITTIQIGPLLSGAIYEAAVRHVSVYNINGEWVFPTTSPANASGQFALGTTGNVNYAAIAAAGGTALWGNITGPGLPADNATVGAIAGVNLFSGGTTILPTTNFYNNALSLSTGGVLSGGGSSGTINALNLLNGPAESGATLGSVAGVNFYKGNYSLFVNEDFYNNALSLSIAGVLSGGGASGTINALNLLNGPAQSGATVGSVAGVNLYSSGTTILPTGDFYNNSLSLSAAGVLSGGGATGTINALNILNGPAQSGATVGAVSGTNFYKSNLSLFVNEDFYNNSLSLSAGGVLSGGGASGTINALNLLNGPAESGATYGAVAGANLFSSGTTVLPTIDFYNNALSISSAGVLSGGGASGTVTSSGLGIDVGNIAAAADNFIRNSQMKITTTDNWWGNMSRVAGSVNGDPLFYASASTTRTGNPNNSEFYEVVAGETIHVSAWLRRSLGTLANFRFNFAWKTFNGTAISTTIVNLAAETNTWVLYKTLEIVPATATYAVVTLTTVVSSSTINIFAPRIARTELGSTLGAVAGANLFSGGSVLPTTNFFNNALSLSAAGVLSGGGSSGTVNATQLLNGPLEAGADVTSIIIPGKTPIALSADSNGVIKTSNYPKVVAATLSRNGANVSSSIVWSWMVVSGTVNGVVGPSAYQTNTSTGGFSLTINSYSGGNTGKIRLKSVYAGTTRTVDIPFEVTNDPVSVGTSGGGGGTAGTTSSISSFLDTSSTGTVYGSSDNAMPNVRTGANATLNFSGFLSYYVDGTNVASVTALGVYQWRAIGGTWADVATEVTGSSASRSSYIEEGITMFNEQEGFLNTAMSKSTGLTANTDYEIRFRLRDSSTSRSAVLFSGNATCNGT